MWILAEIYIRTFWLMVIVVTAFWTWIFSIGLRSASELIPLAWFVSCWLAGGAIFVVLATYQKQVKQEEILQNLKEQLEMLNSIKKHEAQNVAEDSSSQNTVKPESGIRQEPKF